MLIYRAQRKLLCSSTNYENLDWECRIVNVDEEYFVWIFIQSMIEMIVFSL